MMLKQVTLSSFLVAQLIHASSISLNEDGISAQTSDEYKYLQDVDWNASIDKFENSTKEDREREFLKKQATPRSGMSKQAKKQLADTTAAQEELMLRKFRYQFIMAFWVRYRANLDKLSQKWEDFKSRITNYGCFCFNEQNLAGGRGQARDLIDQSCKNLYKCQTCIKMDTANKNILPNMDGTCSLTTTYSFNLTKNEVTEAPEIECQNLEGTCKRALCECDKRFAFELANSYDTWNIWKGKEAFDRPSTCRSVGGAHIGQIDECCGTYPFRYPYHSNEGRRACCGVKTYDVIGPKQCCSDNVLRDECPNDGNTFFGI